MTRAIVDARELNTAIRPYVPRVAMARSGLADPMGVTIVDAL